MVNDLRDAIGYENTEDAVLVPGDSDSSADPWAPEVPRERPTKPAVSLKRTEKPMSRLFQALGVVAVLAFIGLAAYRLEQQSKGNQTQIGTVQTVVISQDRTVTTVIQKATPVDVHTSTLNSDTATTVTQTDTTLRPVLGGLNTTQGQYGP